MAYRALAKVTIADLKEEKQYPNRLAVRVVKVLPPQGVLASSSSSRALLADGHGWIRANISASQDTKVVEGRSVTLKAFTVRDKVLYINDKTLIFQSSPVEVPREIWELAEEILAQPIHGFVSLAVVQSSPVKTKISTKGLVISNHSKRRVMVRGVETDVREVEVEDATGKAIATLWRETSDVQVEVGDDILFKDVTVTYSSFHKKMLLNVNTPANMEVNSSEEKAEVVIVGVKDEPQDDVCLLVEFRDSEREVMTEWRSLLRAGNIEESITLDNFLALLPLHVQGKIKNNRLIIIS